MKLFNQEIVYRLVPCPCYDVEACESWLTDMAARGLFVETLGRTLARFRRGTPCTVRYRLTAARLEGGWLDMVPSEPRSAEKALYAESGWQFVCAQQEFFLYACRDPRAPELHTDPAVQALSLKMARRSAWWGFVWAVIALAVQFALNGQGQLVRLLVEMPALSLCLCLYFLSVLLLAFRDLYHILALSRRLRRGYAPDHRKNWRPAARINRILQGVAAGTFCLVVSLCFVLLVQAGADQSIRSRQEPLPFATLTDLAGGMVLDDEENSLVIRHSLLAPTIMEYYESGRAVQNGETVLDASLRVNYYETYSAWLARLLVDDLQADLEMFADHPEVLPELPGVDAAWGYSNKNGAFRQLFLLQGNRVVSALWTDSAGTLDYAQLARISAAVFAETP